MKYIYPTMYFVAKLIASTNIGLTAKQIEKANKNFPKHGLRSMRKLKEKFYIDKRISKYSQINKNAGYTCGAGLVIKEAYPIAYNYNTRNKAYIFTNKFKKYCHKYILSINNQDNFKLHITKG